MMYAKQYFKKHGDADVLYFTIDSLAFPDELEAGKHADALDDNTVIPITRAEAHAAMRDMGIRSDDDIPDNGFEGLDEE